MSRANEFESISSAREQFNVQGFTAYAPFPNFPGMQMEMAYRIVA